MKAEILNLLSLESNIEHDIISYETLHFPPLDSENFEHCSFSGTFVLDPSMFCSKSYGIIIIIDGNENFLLEKLIGI